MNCVNCLNVTKIHTYFLHNLKLSKQCQNNEKNNYQAFDVFETWKDRQHVEDHVVAEVKCQLHLLLDCVLIS